MHSVSFKLIVLIFGSLHFNVNSQRNEGDHCTIESLSIDGICTLISSCPSAMELLDKKGIYPQTCGFKNTTPIVCCLNSSLSMSIITSGRSTPITEKNQDSSSITTQNSIPLVEVQNTSRLNGLCTIQSLGVNGTCTLITFCPSAMKLLERRRIFPQICGFENNYPMVCCANESFPTITTNTPTRTTTTNRPDRVTQTLISTQPGMLHVGDKSRQKCQEYGKYAFVEAMIEVVPGRDPPPPIADCAITSVENIVGGTDAKPKEFPHMALIGYEVRSTIRWSCGGSLISEMFVLSAAHCVHHEKFGPVKHVLLGDLQLNSNTDDANPQLIAIKRSIRHPNYVSTSVYHDIALIELERNVIFNPYVRPACLNTNANRANELGVASGWGGSSKLKKVVLELFSNRECNYTYRTNIGGRKLEYGIVEKIQMCAGSQNEQRDTCQGDSGGPLQVINSEEIFCTHLILGITSFGKECGVINNPGVYTRVSAYIKWIEDIVWP